MKAAPMAHFETSKLNAIKLSKRIIIGIQRIFIPQQFQSRRRHINFYHGREEPTAQITRGREKISVARS